MENKVIVGSEEWCVFPSLGIHAVKARVDSGAKTSSLHAYNIQPFKRDGETWVRFIVHPLQGDIKTEVSCESRVIDRRMVKSSSGTAEKRYVISVPLQMGNESWDVELTLTNRDSMGYRMLLGREAMLGRILVDPSTSFCLGSLTRTEVGKLYGIAERVGGGLKIGLLASNPELYSNLRLMEAAQERGHEIEFLNIKQCYMKLDDDALQVQCRGGRTLNNLDAVVPRIRPSVTFYGCALLRHFENLGVFCMNSAESVAHSRDKLFSLQILQKSGLDIPTTGFANSPIDTDDLIEMVGGAPLIVKLLEDTQGSGVVLAETKKAAESVIGALKSLKANLLVQEYIKEAQGKDIRCFVVDGKVVASIERRAAPGEFSANLHKGGAAAVVKVTPEEKRLAIKAAKTLGLRVAGVDMIRSNRGPLLLEVNSSPGLEGIEIATSKDIAGIMIESIEKQLGWVRGC